LKASGRNNFLHTDSQHISCFEGRIGSPNLGGVFIQGAPKNKENQKKRSPNKKYKGQSEPLSKVFQKISGINLGNADQKKKVMMVGGWRVLVSSIALGKKSPVEKIPPLLIWPIRPWLSQVSLIHQPK
jgi:hypothetical protein